MKVLLITQDEPLFMPDSLDHLLSKLTRECDVVGCVLLGVSPFGTKQGFAGRAWRMLRIFGVRFFTRYSALFALRRLSPGRAVADVLRSYRVPEIRLAERINAPSSLETIRALKPDLLVSIAGNEIFRRPLLDLAPLGCINLHSSLLPRYRGLMPSFWVLKEGERETGVSVFFVDEGIDSGPIIVQKKMPIAESMSQEDLIQASKQLGMDAIVEAVRKIRSGTYTLQENDAALATYFSFPTRSDVRAFRKAGRRFY